MGLKEAEVIDFKYTTLSLNEVYEIGMKHAIKNIERQGGKVSGDQITIPVQTPTAVKFEKSFDGVFPVLKIPVTWSTAKDEITFDFEGTGFVLRGDASEWDSSSDYVFKTQLYIDGKLSESPELPVRFTTRRHELAWNYTLPKGTHSIRLKIMNPSAEYKVKSWDALIYSDKPVNGLTANTGK
jgi:hypothetical protein